MKERALSGQPLSVAWNPKGTDVWINGIVRDWQSAKEDVTISYGAENNMTVIVPVHEVCCRMSLSC